MPNQFAYSKTSSTAGTGPSTRAIIVAGDVDPAKMIALVEKYWGGWKRGGKTLPIPQEPPAKGRSPRTCRGRPRRCPGSSSPSTARPSRRRRRPARARRALRSQVRPDVRPLQEARREGADGRLVPPNVDINEDPSLVGVFARLKKGTDPVYVRDEILRTIAALRDAPVDAKRLADAKSNARYGLVRGLDDTERIAGLLARFVRLRRSYGTLNTILPRHRLPDAGRPAGRREDVPHGSNLVLTTLSKDALPEGMARRAAASYAAAAKGARPVRTSRGSSRSPRSRASRSSSSSRPGPPRTRRARKASPPSPPADRGRRFAGPPARRDPQGALPDGGARSPSRPRDDDLHGRRPQGGLGRFADAPFRSWSRQDSARRTSGASRRAEERARAEPPEQQRRGTRQGAPAAADLHRHAVRAPRARHGRRHRRDHARGREDLCAEGVHARLVVGVAGDVPADFAARVNADVAKLPAGPALPEPAGVVGRKPSGHRRRPRAEGDALDSHLVRLPDRRHAQRTPTSPPSRSRARGSASTARPSRTSTSASASCAG